MHCAGFATNHAVVIPSASRACPTPSSHDSTLRCSCDACVARTRKKATQTSQLQLSSYAGEPKVVSRSG
jgi:hypothetical protein